MKDPYTPPRLAQRFLLWFLKDELAKEVLGDLDERFECQLEKSSLVASLSRKDIWRERSNWGDLKDSFSK